MASVDFDTTGTQLSVDFCQNRRVKVSETGRNPPLVEDVGVVAPTDEDRTDNNRATYDRIAEGYLASRLQQSTAGDKWWAPFERSFVDALPVGGLVADLGCGPGVDATRLAAAGFAVVGMDLSLGMLKVAGRKLSGQLAQADLRELPIRSGSLDGVWCSAALLHVPVADTGRVLGEIRRALRPSGHLALVTAVGHGTQVEAVPYAEGETRWFVYRDPDELKDAVITAGFDCLVESQFGGNREWLALLGQGR
jgi:SAM-dependent methyltransferase